MLASFKTVGTLLRNIKQYQRINYIFFFFYLKVETNSSIFWLQSVAVTVFRFTPRVVPWLILVVWLQQRKKNLIKLIFQKSRAFDWTSAILTLERLINIFRLIHEFRRFTNVIFLQFEEIEKEKKNWKTLFFLFFFEKKKNSFDTQKTKWFPE